METKIPIYKMGVSEIDDSGIYAMSFVDYPANESKFIALNREKKVALKLDKQKQILTGVVLIPDQLIYRYDEIDGEYYMQFSAEQIEKISIKMMRTGVALTNTTHQHLKKLRNNHLVEMWTVKDSKRDKSAALGLGEFPPGTLIASYKVNDAKYWREEVMSGNVKGFSLEGIFNFKKVSMSKKTISPGKNGLMAALGAAVVKVLMEGSEEEAKELADNAGAVDETDSGTPYMIFPLADGGEIWVDKDNYCTLNDEAAPAGEHALADGNVIAIDDESMLIETKPEADGGEAAEAEAQLRAAALAKGKAHFKKTVKTPEQIIADLKAENARLKKTTPSAEKAKPKAGATDQKKADLSTVKGRAAAILRARNFSKK